jgi:transposase InsO family protein
MVGDCLQEVIARDRRPRGDFASVTGGRRRREHMTRPWLDKELRREGTGPQSLVTGSHGQCISDRGFLVGLCPTPWRQGYTVELERPICDCSVL